MLNANSDLQEKAAGVAAPAGFTVEGDAVYGDYPERQSERVGRCVRFFSGRDKNGDGARRGSVSQTVKGITAKEGRWFRFRIRGLAQDGFRVQHDALFLKVEFFRDGGTNSLDHVQQSIYGQIAQERDDLRDQATNANLGLASWRSYDLDFRTPFPEVDTLRLSVTFDHGAGQGEESEFRISEFELTRDSRAGGVRRPDRRPRPTSRDPRRTTRHQSSRSSRRTLVLRSARRRDRRRRKNSITRTPIDCSTARTASRLRSPTTCVPGCAKADLDRAGQPVKKDRFIADNVRLTFTETDLVVHSHNLPNHPTAVFPDRWRALDGNPNYIREQNHTWFIPLEPRENPEHVAIQPRQRQPSVAGRADRHRGQRRGVLQPVRCRQRRGDLAAGPLLRPSEPGFEYHYHKYPVCVKSPWTDDGTAHSPLIGFAFDGFPDFRPVRGGRRTGQGCAEKSSQRV